jgi:hypothetical protein
MQDNILINEQHRACVSGFRQSVKLSSRLAECPRSQMPPRPAIQFAGPEWFVKNDTRFQPLPQSLFKSDIYSLGCVMFYVRSNLILDIDLRTSFTGIYELHALV